jgi:hypothetical protein
MSKRYIFDHSLTSVLSQWPCGIHPTSKQSEKSAELDRASLQALYDSPPDSLLKYRFAGGFEAAFHALPESPERVVGPPIRSTIFRSTFLESISDVA